MTAVHGETSLEAIDVRDRATRRDDRLESGGLFIFIGADAETAWLPPEIALDRARLRPHRRRRGAAGGWELDRDPYLLETSVPGIFACGDVRFSPVKRVAAAVGEGSMAIAFVHQFLREVDTKAGDRPRRPFPRPTRPRPPARSARGRPRRCGRRVRRPFSSWVAISSG